MPRTSLFIRASTCNPTQQDQHFGYLCPRAGERVRLAVEREVTAYARA
ncbi:hypothetical protein [Paraburkholderia atlantica]|uniref:Uncharacterized protein n=1 Tax=Paraburkholderia atlantica TaxID=2654982 RepID=D5WGU0_PARAM|nr:hypothetical protein [Paraburkholderia atlantica]ADG17685.1 hypothetical protein BC1002_3660 [Paraburkholderia atlantica]MBB5508541.1 hypothetical protein [Paraburkholderia atlantica]